MSALVVFLLFMSLVHDFLSPKSCDRPLLTSFEFECSVWMSTRREIFQGAGSDGYIDYMRSER
jgi:hypothetical protein